MKNITNTEGITPTPEFITNQHTGKFFQILPNVYMIKGAKNDRGFNQAYAIKKRNREEYILIDAVDMATKEAVEDLLSNGHKIEAILLTGESVLQDAYADLQTISDDAGGAAIYIHSENTLKDDFPTKDLNGSNALINSYGLSIYELPGTDNAAVLIYLDQNGGILFTGDSAKGSPYGTDEYMFSRDTIDNKKKDFEVGESWIMFEQDFNYLFPRQGKPAVEVDAGTRSDILNKLRKGN